MARTLKPKNTTKKASKKKATKRTASKKKSSRKKSTKKSNRAQTNPYARVFAMPFGKVYPLYIQKAEKKGHSQADVDTIIHWLTGYTQAQINATIANKLSFEEFFNRAPAMNPKVSMITGVVCGIRVENVDDPLMQKIRYLDKLIDELARGKKMTSILRS